jgi:hypothetical protein
MLAGIPARTTNATRRTDLPLTGAAVSASLSCRRLSRTFTTRLVLGRDHPGPGTDEVYDGRVRTEY